MITCFACRDERLEKSPELGTARWIDLLNPSPDEVLQVEQATGLSVSSAAELQEIESSSRQYVEDGALYLSYPMVMKPDGKPPLVTHVGFVLSPERLLTIRYAASRVFDLFIERLPKQAVSRQSSPEILISLIEAIVDRLADILEMVRDDLDRVSQAIFADVTDSVRKATAENRMQRAMLTDVGRAGDLISRIRDSLLGLGRMLPYIRETTAEWTPHDIHPRLKTLAEDVQSLSDYDAHLSNKVAFLQDAILGFINISQNNIIKVLTVVSVVGVPPTLFASIYGMNFKHMPELDWAWGYPYGLAVITLSAVVPLVWFRARGWL